MAKISKPASHEAHWGGGLAGATTGTSLLALVQVFPEGSPYKTLLTYLSPSITIITTLLWTHVYLSTRDWLSDRRVKSEKEKADRLFQEAAADVTSSEEFRKLMQKKKEDFRLIMLDLHMRRVEIIKSIDKL